MSLRSSPRSSVQPRPARLSNRRAGGPANTVRDSATSSTTSSTPALLPVPFPVVLPQLRDQTAPNSTNGSGPSPIWASPVLSSTGLSCATSPRRRGEPEVSTDGVVEVAYRLDGPPDGPVVLLANSLGTA